MAVTLTTRLTQHSTRLPPAVPTFPIWRMTVEEYLRLVEIGFLTEDDDVELLEGWIVPKMPRNPPHDSGIERTEDSLRIVLPPGWRIRIQMAITTRDSVPEPDLAVVKGPAGRYDLRHPTVDDLAMIAEIADWSLNWDRTKKLLVYARAAVPIYWIVNTKNRQVEVFTDPTGSVAKPKYRQRKIYRIGGSVPVRIAGKEVGSIPVADLIPSRRTSNNGQE
jgi:Uma2 family endonuclease